MPKQTEFGLPIRPFLYTIDQLADLLAIAPSTVKAKYLYFENISTGIRPKERMLARNIAPDDGQEWRVAENELKRWLRYMGFRVYDKSTLRI